MKDIVVTYSCTDQLEQVHTGALLGDLTLRDPHKPGQGLGNARQLLGAAVLSCMCSSLAAALDSRGLGDAGLFATAAVHIASAEKGQRRVSGISVEVRVRLPAGDEQANANVMAELETVLAKGCLITASLGSAIPVTATLRREDA